MVKIVRSFPAPVSLQEEAKKKGGSYEKNDVVEQLKRIFIISVIFVRWINCRILKWNIYCHIKMESI